MVITDIPHDTLAQAANKPPRPGMWGKWATYRVVTCHACGRTQRLDRHAVAPDGVLSPGLKCAHAPFCGWAPGVARLVDWSAA